MIRQATTKVGLVDERLEYLDTVKASLND